MGLFLKRTLASLGLAMLCIAVLAGLGGQGWQTSIDPTGVLFLFDSIAIGHQGSRIRSIKTGTVTINPANLGAETRGATAATIPGAAVGDIILLNLPSGPALNDDLIFVGADVGGADTIRIFLYNPTAGAIDDGATTWTYLFLDVT